MQTCETIEHAEGEGWVAFSFECDICGKVQAHVFPLPQHIVGCTACGFPHDAFETPNDEPQTEDGR